MVLTAIFAQLNCSDLKRSTEWFATIFDRGPDARPMQGLAEWHHGSSAGFQLYQNPADAGHGTLTLIVRDVRAEHARLSFDGIRPGNVETADYTTILRLHDPDRNLVVLAQPKY
ncbi:glyoxalase/bleomycin resistance/dioxygenase family protein [Ochrobactrum vermis]|uniref:Glyoxalase/bleomycin resistance/dioxygenase family protein n=1 Tax=Ochrobactrum vermis TaxID=1827297 RepID=A0ABU8P8P4_9HYPH|nr:glyoxalase/bleomycin resistance/dioxygenase family protein [Ochrobactrum vermis]PQZ31160.1 glyoxalase/bleomycin resistance/dioxygenase family protein [Ochrobactrum vermis]